jgi:hypothetical protein|tara:strand:- start:1762 stop:2031 length:270 start_codon:yes stop_codon:yes gene_type:complete
MTQHDERVSQQRLLLEAEKWAKVPKSVHIHQLKSMWYDDRPQDTDEGRVTDIQYNNGLIIRQRNGETIHVFGEEKTGQELIDLYCRGGE